MVELNNNKRFVRWQVFVWAIGIILLLFSVAFGIIGSSNSSINRNIDNNTAKINKNGEDIVNIKVFIGATGETLKNIDKTLLEIKAELKNKK